MKKIFIVLFIFLVAFLFIVKKSILAETAGRCGPNGFGYCTSNPPPPGYEFRGDYNQNCTSSWISNITCAYPIHTCGDNGVGFCVQQSSTCNGTLNRGGGGVCGQYGYHCCDPRYPEITLQPTPTSIPADCSTKFNGYCTSDPQCQSNTVSKADDAGCKSTNQGTICCVPNVCSNTGGTCGNKHALPPATDRGSSRPGDAYCCKLSDECIITGQGDVGVCKPAGTEGAPCQFDGDCSYRQGFKCDKTVGKCSACVGRDKTGCSNNGANCCIANDVCNNTGTCVSSDTCKIGSPCTNNDQCCSGQTCENSDRRDSQGKYLKVCTGKLSPPGTVKNPCPNNMCDTALGRIDVSTGQDFMKAIFGAVLSIAGGIALILIIYSGYTMTISQGNPEKIKGARETLTSAIVGLLFIIFATVILQIIGFDILALPGFSK